MRRSPLFETATATRHARRSRRSPTRVDAPTWIPAPSALLAAVRVRKAAKAHQHHHPPPPALRSAPVPLIAIPPPQPLLLKRNGASYLPVSRPLRRAAEYGFACFAPPKHELTCDAAALEDFLRNYKSSSVEAADALEGLQIDGDDDEYDFMDESDDATGNRRSRDPKHKYMQLLQDIADRKIDQVIIELDDLDEVSFLCTLCAIAINIGCVVREEPG